MKPVTFIDHAPRVFVVGVSTPQQQGFSDYLAYRGVEWNTDAVDLPPLIKFNVDLSPEELERNRKYLEEHYKLGRAHRPVVLTDDVEIIQRRESSISPEVILEAAGRVCYQSWDNPSGKTREEYLQSSIIEHRHGSVVAHGWVNTLVADLPRSTQLELVRHSAGTEYSFESTRFTDKFQRFIVPPAFRDDPEARTLFMDNCRNDVAAYRLLQARVKDELAGTFTGTLRRKRAKEAARSVLPNALGSDGMFSLNMRAARHIIETRTAPAADESIREFIYAVYQALSPLFPSVFADAKEVELPWGVPSIEFAVSKV
jgi:thymidylate synthase (FAD)